uniref:Coiled-coil domain containing 170 n=2 Tax=Molossus molossus TaxID=27622 RepID=A0A7J8GPN1_MOLMO|nr:coiled-coil domain containing 170 [Molossus molossus]
MSRGASSGRSRRLDPPSDVPSPAPEEIYDHLLEAPATREQLNHYRNVAEDARSDLAAAVVKFECAQSELRDLRSKMLSKEASCQELKAKMENYQENNARKSSLLTFLRDRVQELEEELATLSTSKIRTEITAHTTIKENQELKKKVVELDEKLQKCLKENEENKNQVSKTYREHEEFLAQLRDCLDPERKNEKMSDEDVIIKLRELCKENASVKGHIAALEETVSVHEMEAKASRETIMRLVSEVHREQQKAASCAEQKGRLQQDLRSAVGAREALEQDVGALREAWQRELGVLREQSCGLETRLKASLHAAEAARGQHATFRGRLAALLGASVGMAGPTEEAILEEIREMSSREESQKRMVSQLEARISELAAQLENESGLHQKALLSAQKAEHKLETLQGQLTHLQGELVSGDVFRDNLNSEKQKYLKFLDQLSEKMKLDQMAAELGFDMRLDIVLARAEQLVRLESNAVVENKTIAHSLQRKLKTQKERLESKDLHLNLLRQKVARLEEERRARTALAVQWDEAALTVRKLQKQVERLQKELSVCRESNTELKARLADTNELKIKTLEQTKAIEDLSQCRDRLEKMKEEAEKKLVSVRSELDMTAHKAKEDKERARNTMDVVTSERKTLKKSLEEAEKREKQLVDFREVVSQMLGLNVTSLALPDYEIIKCLERLIHSHRHHFVTCACLRDVTARQDRHLQSRLKLLR